MKRIILVVLIPLLILFESYGQRKILNLPDLKGYVILKCDFHMHTVFSDGSVWPVYRIGEAYRDGLDAIAITDHIEYSPYKDFVPVDQNAAWKIALPYAKAFNLILVHAAEITRDMPPGHLNALFISDANGLVRDSAYDAIEAAVKQGAFIQWNHPGWKAQEPDGIPKLYDLHRKLISNGWINGIEFFNDTEFYPLVLDWCIQYNIAVMGNSDIHGIISEEYKGPDWKNRPMTLVFAKERTAESLKEALFAGRTLVWFKDMLAGKEEYARQFFNRSISIGKVYFESDKNRYFEITNKTDIPYYLVNGPVEAPEEIIIQANSITRVVLSKKFQGPLVYDVKNVLTGSASVLRVELKY